MISVQTRCERDLLVLDNKVSDMWENVWEGHWEWKLIFSANDQTNIVITHNNLVEVWSHKRKKTQKVRQSYILIFFSNIDQTHIMITHSTLSSGLWSGHWLNKRKKQVKVVYVFGYIYTSFAEFQITSRKEIMVRTFSFNTIYDFLWILLA